jgi:uncharacterized repeat protein (TIGR03803 family)
MPSKKLIAAMDASVLIFATLMTMVSSTFATSSEAVLDAFQSGIKGNFPVSNLVFDAEGHLYGTTFYGGRSNACGSGCGTVFELSRDKGGKWAEIVLYAFHGQLDGQNPAAGLVLDKAGNLYGTTVSGGRFSFGSVFKLSPMKKGRWKETTLHQFTGGYDGGNPYAGLVFDNAGHLYGTTFAGGNPKCFCGTAFELSLVDKRWKETVLYSPSTVGQALQPYGSLTFDAEGRLYGTSSVGGEGCGTVFRLTPSGDGHWSPSILYNFKCDGSDGYYPFAGVVLNKAGDVLGTTVRGGLPGCINGEGCGTVFQLTHTSDGGWMESILHRFTGGEDGANPFGGLTFDSGGDLLGTTWGNGFEPCRITCGTVFRLSTGVPSNRPDFKVLYRFKGKGTRGSAPGSSLVLDAAGNLYGTTAGGGAFNGGVVFEITP